MLTSRPHCEAPQACAAKGPGHCRRCGGRAAMAALRSDPAFVERLVEKARNVSPRGRAAASANMTRLNKDLAFAAARDAKGRDMMLAFSADPVVVEHRTLKLVITKAMHLARRLRIPLHLVDDFRELRGRGVPDARAVGLLARAHPDAFRALRDAEAAKHRRVIDRRAFGPVPMGEPPAGRSALDRRRAEQAASRAGVA